MKTILIVDDEIRILEVLEKMLIKRGFNILKAADAMQAHKIILENNFNVDLMLLDINMPEVRGEIYLEIIQSFYQKTRVIVCSVLPVEEQIRLMPEATDYYDKSENFGTLLRKIDLILGEEKSKKKILIIDDDPHIRLLFRRVLLRSGYIPIDSSDNAATILFLKKQIKNIDLILLDIAMPRVSGLEFFNMIKKEHPQAKIIISSVFSADQQKFFIFKADDYFDKSESYKVLLKKIDRLINDQSYFYNQN